MSSLLGCDEWSLNEQFLAFQRIATLYLQAETWSSLLESEDEGTVILQGTMTYELNETVSRPRKLGPSATPL
jgi:hypothetical protein